MTQFKYICIFGQVVYTSTHYEFYINHQPESTNTFECNELGCKTHISKLNDEKIHMRLLWLTWINMFYLTIHLMVLGGGRGALKIVLGF
jgi:hypothetical protein